MPASIIDEVLSGTSVQLPRNSDGSVSVRCYAEWYISLGEEVDRELQEQTGYMDCYNKTAYADCTE